MKIVCVDNALASGEDLWLTVRSDSSVLRNNDDFYIPSFSQNMRCTVGYYLRVTRLAKCLNEKFASRCYDAVGVAVAFTAQDIVERNCALGRPCDEAYCFDKSIALSPETIAPDVVANGVLDIKIGKELVNSDLQIVSRQGSCKGFGVAHSQNGRYCLSRSNRAFCATYWRACGGRSEWNNPARFRG